MGRFAKPYFVSSTDNGFPSDHTVVSALLGLIVLRYSRKLGMAVLLVTLLIGIARVIAGVHHSKDILGGFVIAVISFTIGIVLLRLYRKVLPAH